MVEPGERWSVGGLHGPEGIGEGGKTAREYHDEYRERMSKMQQRRYVKVAEWLEEL